MLEYLKDPKTAFSGEPNEAPFHRVFDIDVPLWVWYELPEQNYRRRRFGVAMHGIGQMQPAEVLTNGRLFKLIHANLSHFVSVALEWGTLPEGSKVVDVGGGVGTSSLRIARAFSNVKCIIQDFPEVCGQAKNVCPFSSCFRRSFSSSTYSSGPKKSQKQLKRVESTSNHTISSLLSPSRMPPSSFSSRYVLPSQNTIRL